MARLKFEELHDVLTITEVARFLGIGRNTAYEAVRRGEIPHVRIGGRILVPKQALSKMLTTTSVSGRAA